MAEPLTRYRRRIAGFDGVHPVLHRRVNPGVAVGLNFEGPAVAVVKDAAACSCRSSRAQSAISQTVRIRACRDRTK
ncbi:MAG: hypothetical protein FJY54_13045 [Betaproteobacteria bacterium]|nr:hypothetical protein [Betaproteobacteria bacterium]